MKKDNRNESKSCGRTYSGIGGQAVMEGVMMRNGENYAVAVRKENGEIIVQKEKYSGIIKGSTVNKIPFVRGVFAFIDSLVLGMKTLNFSSDIYMQGSETENKPEEQKSTVKKASDGAVTGLIMVVAIVFAIGLFMILPYFASLLFKGLVGDGVWLALIEGVIRIAIFIAYICAISLMEDIKRVFMYHGAEHKCINCLESGKTLTVENVRTSSKEHRRCGTSFLLYVMVISIIFFAFIQTPSKPMRVILRIVLIPVIAGVSFELIRIAGRSNNPVIRALSAPGLWMQRLTTREPDDSMIEVGIRSVEAVFDWKKYLGETFGMKFPEEKTSGIQGTAENGT